MMFWESYGCMRQSRCIATICVQSPFLPIYSHRQVHFLCALLDHRAAVVKKGDSFFHFSSLFLLLLAGEMRVPCDSALFPIHSMSKKNNRNLANRTCNFNFNQIGSMFDKFAREMLAEWHLQLCSGCRFVIVDISSHSRPVILVFVLFKQDSQL